MSNALQRKKLSKQNLEALQDHLTSLSYPDTISEWISLTSTMTGSDTAGAVSKKRRLSENTSQVVSSRDNKYSKDYGKSLTERGVKIVLSPGTIPPVPGETEVHEYFSAPIDIPSLPRFMNDWFEKFVPNEASLVHFLCENLFPIKRPVPGQKFVSILYEHSGPFKNHDPDELSKGDEGIKFPIIKREKSAYLQTPAEEDLRGRSDFVFTASSDWFDIRIWDKIQVNSELSGFPGLSNNLRSCAAAIVAEVKATASPKSFLAARNQWCSMAYTQLMQRVSITREEAYVGDENICQFGYLICGLYIKILKMNLAWNVRRRKSDILERAYNFPVQTIDSFSLVSEGQLKDFIATHNKILRWWLYGYLPSYVNDVTKIITTHPSHPPRWLTTWQEVVAKCECLVNHLPYFFADTGTVNPDSVENPETDMEEQPACKDNVDSNGKYTVYPRWNHCLFDFFRDL